MGRLDLHPLPKKVRNRSTLKKRYLLGEDRKGAKVYIKKLFSQGMTCREIIQTKVPRAKLVYEAYGEYRDALLGKSFSSGEVAQLLRVEVVRLHQFHITWKLGRKVAGRLYFTPEEVDQLVEFYNPGEGWKPLKKAAADLNVNYTLLVQWFQYTPERQSKYLKWGSNRSVRCWYVGPEGIQAFLSRNAKAKTHTFPQEAVVLREQGMNIAQLMRKFGLPRSTIKSGLKRHYQRKALEAPADFGTLYRTLAEKCQSGQASEQEVQLLFDLQENTFGARDMLISQRHRQMFRGVA